MIDFKSTELSDKKAIDSCLINNTYRACDFSFTNMFTWQAKFKTTFAIHSKTLFLRFEETNGQLYYMFPIGKLPLKESIPIIMEDAKRNNKPFQMKGVSAEMWEQLEEAFPNQFEYIHDRNNDEYIYLSEKLITLKGKKLQSKRNHINRFKKDNPDWEYFPITNNNDLDICKQMLDEWDDDKSDKSLRYDYIATRLMLKHFDKLQLVGGGITVNGKLVAFSIGERLTNDTFVVHVEKAFADINGAYTIINQQFIEHSASEYTYINREEDMGLESLRKAKMSYYPDILLKEGIVVMKK